MVTIFRKIISETTATAAVGPFQEINFKRNIILVFNFLRNGFSVFQEIMWL